VFVANDGDDDCEVDDDDFDRNVDDGVDDWR